MIAETPYWRVRGLYVSTLSPNLSSMPLVQGIKGTNGAPTHSATLPYGKCGIAYAGAKVESFHL
jgi:hypothetical protein